MSLQHRPLIDATGGPVPNPLRPVAAWWFESIPPRRIDLCRRLTFGYAAAWLLVRGRYVHDVAAIERRRFQPVGLLSSWSAPPSTPLVMSAWALGLLACTLVAAGRLPRLASSIGSGAVLFIATLTSSYGQVFHTEHLLTVHLLILATATVVERPEHADNGWQLNLVMAATVVTYVVAGIAKLRFGGTDWMRGDVLRQWVAVDNLRKVLLDDPSSSLGGWLAGFSWIWGPIALFTLGVELGAPLALRRSLLRRLWVGTAWLFHVGIYALMAIAFPYQLSGVAYSAFLPLERIEDVVRQTLAGRRRELIGHSS